jgi:hypothetical protein
MMIVMIGSDIEQSDDKISAIKPINVRKKRGRFDRFRIISSYVTM